VTYQQRTKRKKAKKGLFVIALVIFCGRLIGWWYFGPDVKVYVEGSFTEDEVQANIYADVYVSCLKGFGVQLIYHPNQLTVQSVEENEEFLYTPLKILNRYRNSFEMTQIDLPEMTTPFESVYFVGNIPEYDCAKTSDCEACITGKRNLIGTVNLSRVEHAMPFDPSYLFITFASGNNTTDSMRDFDKDVGYTTARTGSSNVRLDGSAVKFGSIRINEASQEEAGQL